MKVTPLKVAIANSGYQIRKVAEKANINQTYMSMACNGRIILSDAHKIAIANVLKKPVKELFPND